jgi:hypothetical protein
VRASFGGADFVPTGIAPPAAGRPGDRDADPYPKPEEVGGAYFGAAMSAPVFGLNIT